MIDSNFLPLASLDDKFNSQLFRNDKLWNEYCDNAFKSNLKLLKDIYKKYSGKYSTPGDRVKFMSTIEFVQLIEPLGIIKEGGGGGGVVRKKTTKEKSQDESIETVESGDKKVSGIYSRDVPLIYF